MTTQKRFLQTFIVTIALVSLVLPFSTHAIAGPGIGTGGASFGPGASFGEFVCGFSPILNAYFGLFGNCPDPTVTLTATPSTIDLGASTNLAWVSENATSCSGSEFDTSGQLTGVSTVSPSQTTLYSITCERVTLWPVSAPTVTAFATVTVTSNELPAVPTPPSDSPASACQDGIDNDGDGLTDYPADRGCISPQGGSEVGQCQDGIDNDNDGLVDLADSDCSDENDSEEGSGGAAPNADLSLSASPTLIRSGETTTLIYDIVDASNCSLAGTNGDSWALSSNSGSQTTSALTTETTYTLSCIDLSDEQVLANITVKIIPSFEEI